MTLKECLTFARKREPLPIEDDTFWVYDEAYIKAKALLNGLQSYFELDVYNLLFCNAFLHYFITTKFNATIQITNPDGSTSTIEVSNTLYDKYKIDTKQFIVSSASDGSSSSSLHTTESMSKGGFAMQELIKTPYGEYVYSILENIVPSVVLL